MSEAFEILSAAVKEAIEDAKSDTPVLNREILRLEERKDTNTATVGFRFGAASV